MGGTETLLRDTAFSDRTAATVKVSPDAGVWRPSVAPVAGTSGWKQLSEAEPVVVCFSCGRPGHGVNRCSRVDTSFLFLLLGWLVDIWDGQYWAVWPGGSMARSQSGNEGWSRREGQPPGPSVTEERLTPADGERAAPVARNRPVWRSLVEHVHGSSWSSTIGEPSANVSLSDTRMGQPEDAGPGSAGAGTKGSGSSELSDRDGWELAIVGCPSARSSATWEGDAACRVE